MIPLSPRLIHLEDLKAIGLDIDNHDDVRLLSQVKVRLDHWGI